MWLIDREAELPARTLILDEAVAILTLISPDGVGKTRLALAIAAELIERFGDGIVRIDFAPLNNGNPGPAALVRALGIVP